jgi:hypothetical protein
MSKSSSISFISYACSLGLRSTRYTSAGLCSLVVSNTSNNDAMPYAEPAQ